MMAWQGGDWRSGMLASISSGSSWHYRSPTMLVAGHQSRSWQQWYPRGWRGWSTVWASTPAVPAARPWAIETASTLWGWWYQHGGGAGEPVSGMLSAGLGPVVWGTGLVNAVTRSQSEAPGSMSGGSDQSLTNEPGVIPGATDVSEAESNG
jgi:hypothetical protein